MKREARAILKDKSDAYYRDLNWEERMIVIRTIANATSCFDADNRCARIEWFMGNNIPVDIAIYFIVSQW